MNKIRSNFSLDPEVVDMLKILAAEDGRTMSSYIEVQIVRRWRKRKRRLAKG